MSQHRGEPHDVTGGEALQRKRALGIRDCHKIPYRQVQTSTLMMPGTQGVAVSLSGMRCAKSHHDRKEYSTHAQ